MQAEPINDGGSAIRYKSKTPVTQGAIDKMKALEGVTIIPEQAQV